MSKLSDLTKTDIINILTIGIQDESGENIVLPIYGRLDEYNFLNKFYDLKNMASYDRRYPNAEVDIRMHTVVNDDYPSGWIFDDERFELKTNDEKFLQFVCNQFNPYVRVEKNKWNMILSEISSLLKYDGVEIYESSRISNRPVYSFRELLPEKSYEFKKGNIIKGVHDEYEIINNFKQGSDANLFEVKDSNENILIMKTIKKTNTLSSSKISRFKNEMDFLYKHSNKNIVKVIDYNISADEKTLFYIMKKYCSDLRTLIKNGIDYQKSIKYFWQICEGLKSAHAEHCWHRDLKPENILYDEEEDIVVVADFGIAHFSDDDKVDKIETKNTEKLANFKYHSPEQVPGKVVEDATADIWALGYILNEMFTNEIPLGENYKKISSVTRIYKNLDLLVSEMIKSDKKERCQSISEVEFYLLYLLEGKGSGYYPNEYDCVHNTFICPSREFIESFYINDDKQKHITNYFYKNEIHGYFLTLPIYMMFIKNVIECLKNTKEKFSRTFFVMRILLNLFENSKFVNMPKYYQVFIAEQLNIISENICLSSSQKTIGKAWDASDLWYSRVKTIEKNNINVLREISTSLSCDLLIKILLNE